MRVPIALECFLDEVGPVWDEPFELKVAEYDLQREADRVDEGEPPSDHGLAFGGYSCDAKVEVPFSFLASKRLALFPAGERVPGHLAMALDELV